jgi:hypothetical protein
MCKHQQQFQRDEQHQNLVLIFNCKTKPGSGWGLEEQ